MIDWHNADTDELCRAILSLTTEEECYDFLEDIGTIKEVLDMSQRLRVARLLRDGVSYQQITKETGASAATISRVSKCVEYGTGYRTILDRLYGEKK